MPKALYCAVCGKRVKRDNGFFQSYPRPQAFHHECVKKRREARSVPE